MTDEELEPVVAGWLGYGQISPQQYEQLRAEYIRRENFTSGCTQCDQFRFLMTHFYKMLFRNQLKEIMSTRKYKIKDDAVLMLPGNRSQKAYVNEGVNSESVEVLTDALAESILSEFPDYSALIIINPDYKEKAATAPKPVAAPAAARSRPAPKPAPTPVAAPATPVTHPAPATDTAPVTTDSQPDNGSEVAKDRPAPPPGA